MEQTKKPKKYLVKYLTSSQKRRFFACSLCCCYGKWGDCKNECKPYGIWFDYSAYLVKNPDYVE